MDRADNIRKIKEEALVPKTKHRKPIPKKSNKRIRQEKQQKELLNGDDTLKEKWFKARRPELTGTCQCGCGNKSQKEDDTYFRGSICHIFPKNDFESVMYHPLNYVERAMFGGCHHNMDNLGVDRWPNFADWDDIKQKFLILEPLLSEDERSKKFYTNLLQVVKSN